MIDNVCELKQRFVGFNKVKLLTVVFYCMTYSWCSCLNEYNAMENQEEEKGNEVPKAINGEEKGKWTVEGDAVVYECNKFKLVYTWDEAFMTFIDAQRQNSFNLSNNAFPVGYDLAIKFVKFLYRHQDALGIEVEGEYRVVNRSELPGCCKSCRKGRLGNRTLLLRKENELAGRIRTIDFMKGIGHDVARKKWMGDINAIPIGNLEADKMALVVIANLFDQEGVGDGGQVGLLLSDKVKAVIHGKSGYKNVSFNDYMPLQGVIVVKSQNNAKNVG